MTNTETDNLDVFNADSESPAGESRGTDDFFEALDRKVNEGILEPEETTVENVQQSESGETLETSPQEDSSNGHDWEKRYTDSSTEARRLNTELKELEPYVPILNAMKQDPDLITHVKDYFEGGGRPPKSVKEELGLDEDFIFDPDEAIQDNESSSAKVLQSVVDGAVQRKLSTYKQGERKRAEVESAEKAFRQQHEMSDKEWGDFVDYSKSRSLTLDDIYFLKNKDNRDKQVANSTRKEMKEQMERVRNKPKSAANSGSQGTVEKSGDDMIFDTILGSTNELEKAFGM